MAIRFFPSLHQLSDLAFFLKKIEEEGEEDVVREYLVESDGHELLSMLETDYERKPNEVDVFIF